MHDTRGGDVDGVSLSPSQHLAVHAGVAASWQLQHLGAGACVVARIVCRCAASWIEHAGVAYGAHRDGDGRVADGGGPCGDHESFAFEVSRARLQQLQLVWLQLHQSWHARTPGRSVAA